MASEAPTFPPENSDYDGRDLREVIAEGDFTRPRWWPANDDEELPVVQHEAKAVREAMLEKEFEQVKDYNIRVTAIDANKLRSSWLAAYLHFESVNSFNYYVDTIGMLSRPQSIEELL